MGDFSVMYLYSLTYFINSIGIFSNKRSQRIVTMITVILLVFISGTRYYMGGLDVHTYERVYNGVPAVGKVLLYFFTGVSHGVNTNYEVGFLFLCSLIKTLGFSYFGFILIWTLIFYTLMIKGLKQFVSNWAVFIAVFMYKLMFYNTFISIRQGLTIAIFCYMLQFIRDRKWYIYFPLCFLAFWEHNAALILFPLYFITYMPITKRFIRNYALLWAPTWFISDRIDLSNLLYSIAEFIGNTHSVEHWAESQEKISIIHTIECYFVVFLVLLFYEKIFSNERKKEVELVVKLFLMAIPIFTLFREWIVLTRVKDYFVLMYGIIFGYIFDGGTTTVFSRLKTDPLRYDMVGKRNYKIITIAILVLCFVGMIRFVRVFDGGELVRFNSFIFEDVSIFR